MLELKGQSYQPYLNGTRLEMIDCKLKGDELANNTYTAGVVSVDADIKIRHSEFENFKSGAIMI